MTKDAFIERISFPAERGHHGAALGNGCLGLLLWGSGRTLRVSIGCCALWDHEGGIEEYPAEFRMENVKQALAQGNEAFLRQCAGEGQSHAPSLIPAGRLEIQLPEGAQLEECLLPLDSGKAIVRYRRNNASSGELEFLLGRGQEMQALFAVKNPEHFSCRLISSQELNSDGFFSKNHYPPISRLCARPRAVHSRRNSADGFVQNLPEGGGYALLLEYQQDVTVVKLDLFSKKAPSDLKMPRFNWHLQEDRNRSYWRDLWNKVPRLRIPNRKLAVLYRNGLRLFGSTTSPDGIAPGLQGPFLEDDRMPPYGADYHFNVNAQMIHAPALQANLHEHLKPLLRMMISWKKKLRNNAWRLAGIKNGILLPHATDDRGAFMGWGFWSGMLDFAAGAWVSDMLWNYVLASGDDDFLRKEGFDFMKGCMTLCQAVLERNPDGSLSLPISVSPEFHGTELSSVGPNASYQLAAIHRLARNLTAAAEMLHISPDPFWREVMEKLPAMALADGPHGGSETSVFDGIKLTEGHRHHSHLGGIWPFATLSPDDECVKRACISWLLNGNGFYLGWSFSWAARLLMRFGYAEAAETLLEIIQGFFMNHGHLPTGLSRYRGISAFARPGNEMMQLDVGMDAVGTVLDMFIDSRDGVVRLLPAIPESWEFFHVRNLGGTHGVRFDCQWKASKGARIKLSLRDNRPFLLKLPGERFGRWESLSGLEIAPDNSCRIGTMKNGTLKFVTK